MPVRPYKQRDIFNYIFVCKWSLWQLQGVIENSVQQQECIWAIFKAICQIHIGKTHLAFPLSLVAVVNDLPQCDLSSTTFILCHPCHPRLTVDILEHSIDVTNSTFIVNGTNGVLFITIVNWPSDSSSNPEWGCLYFRSCKYLWEKYDSNYSPSNYGQITWLTGLFDFGIDQGKLFIQISCKLADRWHEQPEGPPF